jgi:DNA/RNA-binding domain of Phe-tRNA-synthetase-like protein
MLLSIEEPVTYAYSGLAVLERTIMSLTITRSSPALQEEKERVAQEVRSKLALDTLKDQHPMRAYRDFFWHVGIDPTKNRPASEALIRRVLSGKPLPTINTLVDAYNLASIKSGVPIAAFDGEKLEGGLRMRFAKKGETFRGIGMDAPTSLTGVEVVIEDQNGITAVYPYRDADRTRIQEGSNKVVLLFCGVPGVEEELLRKAEAECVGYITRFCGGDTEG